MYVLYGNAYIWHACTNLPEAIYFQHTKNNKKEKKKSNSICVHASKHADARPSEFITPESLEPPYATTYLKELSALGSFREVEAYYVIA